MDIRNVVSWCLVAILSWAACGAARAAGCDIDPQRGLDAPAAQSVGCASPAEDFIRATPALINGVIAQCVQLTASSSFAGAEAAVRAKIVEIQNKVATNCAALAGPSQLACQVALLTGALGIDAAECVTRGLAEGAPLSESNRKLVKSVLDTVFNLKSRLGFAKDAKSFSSGGMSDADSAKFITDLSKSWEEAAALKFTEGVSSFVGYFNQDAATANALAEAEQQGTSCNVTGTEAALARAVEVGRRNVVEARQAVRDSEREMQCIEQMWRKQLGEGWRQRVEVGEGGPAAQSFEGHRRQAEGLRATEPERLAQLARAGTMCATVQQLRTVIEQGRASYEAMRLKAREILLGSSCDIALAEQVLTVMETLEVNPCKGPLTNTPAEFIARGAPFASAALRGELDRKRRECAAVIAAPASPPGTTARPTISIAGTWNSNVGFVYEFVQTGMSFTWTVSNQPALGERGQGSLTEAGKINASWTNANGGGKADGTVFALDANGRATRITWSNGILFDRN